MSSSDKYVEAGTEGQFEDDVSERHRSGGTFSSEEVSSMTSDQFTHVMGHAGSMQRSHPESFALSGQGQQSKKLGRETWINRDYGSALENVGDVFHRMTAAPSPPLGAHDVWSPYDSKTAQAVSHLERASGLGEGGAPRGLNSDFPKASEEQREWGWGYSKAHAKLPVYTPVQQLANQSAIHLGKHQFVGALKNLRTMRNMEIAHYAAQPEPEVEVKVDPDTGEEAEWTTYHKNPDTEYNRGMSQPASVEFLRSQGR